ncbi:MAG: glycosyltransferase family 2 protein, partial [Chitinophagaceae bacterium]
MKVTILVIAYNHSSYIRQCLGSVLMQDLPFETEIIIADDFSTDNTLEIIREMLDGSSLEFKFLQTEKNLGLVKNYQRSLKLCSGDYIAVIEGDDYWTYPQRLKKHVRFLDSHTECV